MVSEMCPPIVAEDRRQRHGPCGLDVSPLPSGAVTHAMTDLFASLGPMTTARGNQRGSLAAPLAAVMLALGIGVAGGFLAGQLTESDPGQTATSPLEAASPSVPFTPYSADVAYPAWQPDLSYRRVRIGTDPFAWTYLVPKGWESSRSSPNEYKWGVPGHPSGSYGFRIELVLGDHETPEHKVAAKLAALRSSPDYSDIRVLGSSPTENTLAFTYRSSPENWLRYNTFRWFAAPGTSTAAVEISVNGRGIDQEGMNDLLETVSASLQPA